MVVGVRNDRKLDKVWVIKQGSFIQKRTSCRALPIRLVLHPELLELIHEAKYAGAVAEAELPIHDIVALSLLEGIDDEWLDRLAECLIVDLFEPLHPPTLGRLSGFEELVHLLHLFLIPFLLILSRAILVQEDVRKEVQVGVLQSWLLTIELGVVLDIGLNLAQVVQADAEACGEVGEEHNDDAQGDHVELVVAHLDVFEHLVVIEGLVTLLSLSLLPFMTLLVLLAALLRALDLIYIIEVLLGLLSYLGLPKTLGLGRTPATSVFLAMDSFFDVAYHDQLPVGEPAGVSLSLSVNLHS